MAIIRPFKGIRPPRKVVAKVASLPYDVLSSEEARQIAGPNALSFLHISKPEVDLDPKIDPYSDGSIGKGQRISRSSYGRAFSYRIRARTSTFINLRWKAGSRQE